MEHTMSTLSRIQARGCQCWEQTSHRWDRTDIGHGRGSKSSELTKPVVRLVWKPRSDALICLARTPEEVRIPLFGKLLGEIPDPNDILKYTLLHFESINHGFHHPLRQEPRSRGRCH